MAANRHQKRVVVITGSTGLIGSQLTRDLAPECLVVGIDLHPPKSNPTWPVGFHWLHCDLSRDQSVRAALARVRNRYGGKIASVVHLAAHCDFSGQPSPLYQQLTVEGTRRLLDGLQDFDVEQIVYSSSLLVMKPVTDRGCRITEQSDVQAEWAYPQSKLRAEQVICEHRGKIPAVILRVAGVYDESCHSILIAQQIRRIYEQSFQSHFFPGNRSHGQSFVHLRDLSACIRRVIDRRHLLSNHEMFLVGEEGVMSYGELQHAIGSFLHHSRWPTLRVPKLLAKAQAWVQAHTAEPFINPWTVDLADAHYPVNIDRARGRLGWEPRRSLRTTLPTMLRRLRDDPARWYAENGLPLPDRLRGDPRPTMNRPAA